MSIPHQHKQVAKRAAYSVAEFAGFFGRPRGWVYGLVREGKLKALRGLGTMMIPAEELERIVQWARKQ